MKGPEMTSLKQAIDALEPTEGGWRGTVPENWLQGRTAYGGFSAALALHAADELPRSAIGKVLKRELRDRLASTVPSS